MPVEEIFYFGKTLEYWFLSKRKSTSRLDREAESEGHPEADKIYYDLILITSKIISFLIPPTNHKETK